MVLLYFLIAYVDSIPDLLLFLGEISRRLELKGSVASHGLSDRKKNRVCDESCTVDLLDIVVLFRDQAS